MTTVLVAPNVFLAGPAVAPAGLDGFTPAVVALVIQRGTEQVIDAVIADVDPAVIEQAQFTFTVTLDLAAYSAGEIVKTTSAGAVVAALLQDADQTNGVSVQLAPADTSWMPWPHYASLFYTLSMAPADGSGPFTVAEGQLALNP